MTRTSPSEAHGEVRVLTADDGERQHREHIDEVVAAAEGGAVVHRELHLDRAVVLAEGECVIKR